jgi:hypothetical protein
VPLFVVSFALLWVPVAFPERAPVVTKRQTDRVVVGRWFDGSRRREVEEAVWLSPRTVARQDWDWPTARRRFDGSLTFAVRLAALERQDPLEFGGDTAPGDDVSRAVFTLEALTARGDSTPLPLEIVVRWTQRGRDPRELLRIPWLAFLMGDAPERLPLNVGRNQIAAFELRSPLTDAATGAFAYRLRIRTPRRTREAVFRRWPRIESVG